MIPSELVTIQLKRCVYGLGVKIDLKRLFPWESTTKRLRTDCC